MLVACANETTLSHITRTTVTMKHRSLDGSKTTSHQLVETTPPDNNSTKPVVISKSAVFTQRLIKWLSVKFLINHFQCVDTVGCAPGRASGL